MKPVVRRNYKDKTMSLSAPENSFNSLITIMWEVMNFSYDGLTHYVKLSRKLSEKTSSNIAKKIEKWDKKNPKHEYSGHDIYEGEFFSLLNFSQLALTSSIILAHSELEGNLRYICNSIGKEENKKILLNDIHGKGHIDQCKNYLEKVFDVDFSSQEEEWVKIFAFNRLRNILAHQNGIITLTANQKLQQNQDFTTLSKINNIEISDAGQVKIKDEKPINQFIEISWLLLDKICSQLKKH